MFLSKLSINRPIMMTMFILIFIIFGTIAYNKLNLNQTPDVAIPFVTIQTIYPGAGPKEIETQVTKKIEDVISTVSQIERIESYSLDGVSIVMIEFELGKDINIANQEIKDKVDLVINNLPTDAKKPVVQKVDFKAYPIMELVLSGNLSSKELYDIADKTLKDRFSQIQGVANVNITGGRKREIDVVLKNRVAFENSVSLPQLMQLLSVNNMNIPGGYFNINNQEYTVRLKGEFNDINTLKQLQVPTMTGVKKIGQFANVIDTAEKVRQRATFFNNKTKIKSTNIVRIGVIKSPDGNVVKIADKVYASLESIRKALPKGAKLNVIDDRSTFVKSTVDDTMSNILLGVLFTSLILLIFLHDIKATIIVALSMPTSIISTFLLFPMFNMSLNIMSLMGISVSVGVLVANSVVVLENIFRHKKMGKRSKLASYDGTNEVVVAVLAATLTNLVVFIPIANMSSMVGLFLSELALAASFSTIFSLIMSFTLTPMLASLLLKKDKKKGKLASAFVKMENKYEELYTKLLAIPLKNKVYSVITIVTSFILLIGVAIYYGPKIGFDFMPMFDDGKIRIEVELPQGYNIDETASVMNKIENKLKSNPEIKQMVTNLGQKSQLDIGTNLAALDLKIIDKQFRDYSLSDEMDKIIKQLAEIPNAKIAVTHPENMGGGGAPIQLFLLGQNLNTLERWQDTVMNIMKSVPGVINLDNSSRKGKPEITVYPNRKKLSELGLTTMDLALTLRASIEGMVSSQYREFGNEYDIKIKLDDKTIDSPEKIKNITVVSTNPQHMGTYRLSELADVRFTTGYTKILHRDRYKSILFTASNAANVPLGNITNAITEKLDKVKFPTGYSYKWGGMIKMMNDMFLDMAFAFILAVLLTYMLLAAILESFLQPVFILMTMPLALIGVILSVFYFNVSLNISSLMAIIMLIGIVVNNAILMLDYANQLRREENISSKEALLRACPTKLKPIIMSTVAIILGMLPMAMGIGSAGSEMRQALGIVSVGGLIVSTALTLFVIPAFYYVFAWESRYKKDKEGPVGIEKS